MYKVTLSTDLGQIYGLLLEVNKLVKAFLSVEGLWPPGKAMILPTVGPELGSRQFMQVL